MSQADTHRNRTSQFRTEIASLTDKKAKEQKKIADLNAKIQSATRAMNSTRTLSTIQSKQKEILRYQQDIAKVEKNIADFETKIAKKKQRFRFRVEET